MRAFLFGLLLFALFFIFGRWYFVCETRANCGEPLPEQPVVPERARTLYLLHDTDTIAGPFDRFLFPEEKSVPEMNASNRAFLDAVTDFLRDNSEQNVMITGRFASGEKDAPSGFFENLGIARAAHIEGLLEELGIDQQRIETQAEVTSAEGMQTPLDFTVIDNAPTDGDYDIPQYRFEDNTFSDANFELNSAAFTPGISLVAYADSVKTFLEENPDFQLTITGHTDSIGTEEYNMDLGLRRALSAKEYFTELGISAPIETASMGKTQYAAPNTFPDGTDNEAGRQKNRRVNFKLTTQEQ